MTCVFRIVLYNENVNQKLFLTKSITFIKLKLFKLSKLFIDPKIVLRIRF